MTMQVFQGIPFVIDNNEGWIESEQLGKLLGYSRERDFHKLVERHKAFLPGISVRATVARTQMPTGGTRESTRTSYLLREAHVYYLVVKSQTPLANEFTRRFIDAVIELRNFIFRLLTTSAEQATKELEESRAIFKDEQERLIQENEKLRALGSASVNVSGLRPGEKAMVTKLIDTTDAMYLWQVNTEFGFPTSGKHSRMLVSVAQKLNVWGKDGFFVAVPIDLGNGHRVRNHAKMWMPTARSVVAHTVIRRARKLGYPVPFNTLMKYGDPDAPGLSPNPKGVTYTNGVPTLHPVKPKPAKV